MNIYRTEQATDRWLRQNGISAKHFANTDVLLLQAQKTAHYLRYKQSSLLDDSQRGTLQAFLKAMSHQRTQASVTTTQAYQALNIGSKIRRQVFRQRQNFS
jgi:hypothetical protein